jgi:DNA ligase-1
MQQDFKALQEFVNEMNSSNSTNHKLEVLTRYASNSFVVRVLFYTYHPYKQFHLTSETLKKWSNLSHLEAQAELEIPYYETLFDLLDALDSRKISGHLALSAAKTHIDSWSEYAGLIYQVIDRNLETRATTTLINRVIPGLIPTFNVALAHDATKVKGVDLTDGTWFVSRKLDGVRCLAVVKGGDVKFYSRNGKEFHTLDKVKNEILRLGLSDCVLDGELCLQNEEGSDDFQGVLKQIQRKDHTIPNPKYWVFDFLTLEEFETGSSTQILSARQLRAATALDGSTMVSRLKQALIGSEDDLVRAKEESKLGSWEGLIARRDVDYEGERTKNMLKLKEFHDAEYMVKEAIMGPQRVIVNGHEVEEEVLSAVIIEHRGCPVQVGSGFSLDERRKYYKSPEEIVGSTITVQYFEETIDQQGNRSLRFPVFKWNHGRVRSI